MKLLTRQPVGERERLDNMSGRSRNRRLLLMVLAFGACFAGLLGKAFYLQVVKAAEYSQRAERQYLASTVLPVKRAAILDRDGGALALTVEMISVCANPKEIEDPPAAARKLAAALDMKEDEILARLSTPGTFVYVMRMADPVVARRACSLGIKGVFGQAEDKRIYPQGALASQLLGFVGTEMKGLEGLELQYDAQLSGEPGKRTTIVDDRGRVLEVVHEDAPAPGNDVVLTIDKEIQFATEQILTEAVEEYEARKATAIILDPQSGEVLAMATTPVFDANEYLAQDAADRRHYPVTDLFEPGSTFKLVVVAAALSAQLVTPDTVFTLPPNIVVGDVSIGEAYEGVEPERVMSVTQIVARSSNVGAVTLGLKVGKEDFYRMINAFGFTRRTGIDAPGEVAGLLLPVDKWNLGTVANVPIGQGISVTAIQLASAYAAVANDGLWVAPHLTKKSAGEIETRRVVDARVAEQLRAMLKETVESGTGTAAALSGYSVAGKTGTAEKALEDGIGYAEDKYLASFVGMIPADRPRVVILVAVDEPQQAHLGSEVAAPVFARIADFTVKHLGIAPDCKAED